MRRGEMKRGRNGGIRREEGRGDEEREKVGCREDKRSS